MSWPIKPLGELVENCNAKRVPLKQSERDGRTGKYRYYGASGIIDFVDDFLFDGDYLLIGEDGNNLLSRTTPIAFHASGQFWVNNHAHVLKCNGKVDLGFLAYYINSINLEPYITGSAQPKLNKKNLDAIKIPLPPLEEQKRIAAILDKADVIRQKRKQAIELADEFLRSVFLDMFGSDLVRPSDRVSFGDVSILDAKMVDPREEKYLDLLHIGPDRIQKRSGKLLPALTAREEMLISKKFLFDAEYVLYSKIRPYLRKAAIPDFSALCSADMYPVKPVKDKVTREFIWMLLLSDLFDNYVGSLPDRANIPKLNKKELAAFEFSLPNFEKIKKFSDVVKKANYKKSKMEESFRLAVCSFNALSQKAFSGQL
ncbi:restriction endonuclease subunit S [Aliivibrio fischeri]|uniref:restriction endonuclease subunit S n=1 Tax=Aliivibrio fischeri TaxID=668 RepID=UPI0012DA1C0C|nr:restriction endonuclease subunit S [Aliivibrio fischeri]MUJ23896.1 restriction endonuclease subunit S [Aliivibrio fischeri]